ncbi:MAG: DNA repair protein RadC [Deltaproteobacteria bacterium]|nr:DNA repair protein RadC [Deltaproteobacteria bacterium]
MTSLPKGERPREKLLSSGAQVLMDEELLAIILGSGSKIAGVRELSKKVLDVVDKMNGSLTARSLSEIRGIGDAKATLICAALEFARRRIRPEGTKISGPEDVYNLVRHYADRKQEHFIALSLNGAHEVIATRVVTVGLLNSSPVHPREVFCEPIVDRAAAIIIAHNHPSGSLTPSSADKLVTRELMSASKILGIKLLDHVIFGKNGFLSMREGGFWEG